MIGTLLDQRYQVIQILGQGGFGHTYIAEDTRRPGNPTCVVKHLKPATSDPEFLETARRLFNSEAETLEKLGTHDQIPRLLAYFEENKKFYLVQEFIAGHQLTAELPPGQRCSESQVLQLLCEVLSILEFVHGNGVIHRDLKPDNLIRRSSDNKLVLVDFGAVKQVQMYSIITQEPIKETVAIGTPGYMPSEQGQGRPRPSSDIYALGMIGIQALTGLSPRQLSEDSETGEMIWRDYAQVSDGLAAVLTKMTRHYFKYRYQSATEVLQALQQLTNPYTPKALAALVSRRVSYYLKDGYQSANKALRMLQSGSATKALHVSTPSTKPHISLDEITVPGHVPPPGTPTPLPMNFIENTVTVAPVNRSQSRVSSQSSPASVSRTPNKLPLLIGAGTATVVIAIATSAIHQRPPSPTTNPNKPDTTPNKPDTTPNKPDTTSIKPETTSIKPEATSIKPKTTSDKPEASDKPKTTSDKPEASDKPKTTSDKPEAEPKNNCVVVVSSTNVRSLSGRQRTGKVVEAGTKVTVTGKEAEGWIEISSPVSGWLWKSRTKNTCSPS